MHFFRIFGWRSRVACSMAMMTRLAPATTNHGERIGGRKINRAGDFCDGFLPGVNKVGIDLGIQRVRADAKHAIFGLQDHVDALGNIIGNERGHADTEIDVEAVAQFPRDAAGDAFALLVFG